MLILFFFFFGFPPLYECRRNTILKHKGPPQSALERDVQVCSKCQSEHSDMELGLRIQALILESGSQRIYRVAHLAWKTLLQF